MDIHEAETLAKERDGLAAELQQAKGRASNLEYQIGMLAHRHQNLMDESRADNAKLRGLLRESNAALADRIISTRHIHEAMRGTSAFNKYSILDLCNICEKLNDAEWLKTNAENKSQIQKEKT